ncbi:MAG: ATP-binding protein [Burkholderiales bacterium]
MSPERHKRRTLETLVAWALRVAEEAPLLYIMEDLHWVDPTTLEYLSMLQGQAATARLMLLLTACPTFTSPWATRSHLTSVPLDRFSKRQTEQMVARVTANKPLPKEVLEQIAQKTDGVPLFVEELTKMVLESGLLRQTATHYELTGPLPPLAIPSTLQDSLMARLDRLATVKEVAQLAATLGRSFSYSLLREVAHTDEASLERELAKLEEAELLYRRGMGADTTYVFKHALIQDAAYQSLLRITRQIYHERIATAMVQRFPVQAEEAPEFVAHRYTEAGLIAQAVEYWSKAGQAALKRTAYGEAIAYYRRGLDILSGFPASVQRDRLELGLQVSLGYAIIPLKGYAAQEALLAYTRATALAEGVGDTSRLFDAHFGLAIGYWVGPSVDQGRGHAERCLAIAQTTGDDILILAASHVMGGTAFPLGKLTETRRHFERVFVLYDHTKRPDLTPRFGLDVKRNAHHFLVPALWMLGYAEQALARVQELFEPQPVTAFLYNRIWRSVSLVQLLGWLGDSHPLEHIIDAQLAQAYLAAKQTEAGLAAVSEGLASAHQNGERRADAELHRVRGELLLQQTPHDLVQAEAEFQKALGIARAHEAKSLELRAAASLARLWQSQGQREKAYELLAPVYDWFTEGFDTKDLKEARDLLEQLA